MFQSKSGVVVVLVVGLIILPATAQDGTCPLGGCGSRGAAGRSHYWPQARGRTGRYGVTDIVGPSNLSAAVSWSWHHPDHAILTGAVLLDHQKNIVVTAMDGVRKFSPDGDVLWFFRVCCAGDGGPIELDGRRVQFYNHAVPMLYDDAVYFGGITGWVGALDLVTGTKRWLRQVDATAEMDTPYVTVQDGVVLSCGTRGKDKFQLHEGNTVIHGLNASDGSELWFYKSEMVLWNFLPQFPGDGTFVVMDIHGGVMKLGLQNGSRVWYTPPPEDAAWTFTDGGVILDPEGTLYSCANLALGGANTPGVMRAYRHQDGKQLWSVQLAQPCVSWPASDGKTVVVPIGGFPSSMPAAYSEAWVPGWMRPMLHRFSMWLGPLQNRLWGKPATPMLVVAFAAKDGKPKWSFDKIPDWTYYTSRGDEELYDTRKLPWGHRPVCGPASWGSPTIAGDGTVYMGSMNGLLYAIRDGNGDGVIDPVQEVSTLDLGHASLHPGTSFAPGLMAYASCEGVWAFRW